MVGNRAGSEGNNQRNDHGDDGHSGNGGGSGGLILTDVAHAHVKLVANNHVVAEDQQQSADKSLVEVRSTGGWRAELHEGLLEVELFGAFAAISRQFTRNQQHGAYAAQEPADGTDKEADFRGVDESGADDGTHGLANNLTGTIKSAHSAAILLRHAVRQNCHTWCEHTVEANLQQRP